MTILRNDHKSGFDQISIWIPSLHILLQFSFPSLSRKGSNCVIIPPLMETESSTLPPYRHLFLSPFSSLFKSDRDFKSALQSLKRYHISLTPVSPKWIKARNHGRRWKREEERFKEGEEWMMLKLRITSLHLFISLSISLYSASSYFHHDYHRHRHHHLHHLWWCSLSRMKYLSPSSFFSLSLSPSLYFFQLLKLLSLKTLVSADESVEKESSQKGRERKAALKGPVPETERGAENTQFHSSSNGMY